MEIYEIMSEYTGKKINFVGEYKSPTERKIFDTSELVECLEYNPSITMKQGIPELMEWFINVNAKQ